VHQLAGYAINVLHWGKTEVKLSGVVEDTKWFEESCIASRFAVQHVLTVVH